MITQLEWDKLIPYDLWNNARHWEDLMIDEAMNGQVGIKEMDKK
jgi:hypothetical protein